MSVIIESKQFSDLDQDMLSKLGEETATILVARRNGKVANFQPEKIALAITQAFGAVEGEEARESNRVREIVLKVTNSICKTFIRRWSSGGTVHIEAIQDQVEIALMRSGQAKVAKEYILYRERRNAKRRKKSVRSIHITGDSDQLIKISESDLEKIIEIAAYDLPETKPALVAKNAFENLFEGAAQKDLNKALTLSARTLIERDPSYSFLAARLLKLELMVEATAANDVAFDMYDPSSIARAYREGFIAFLNKGVKLEIINPELLDFDLEFLADHLDFSRDEQFTYLGLQTLYDRYFIHDKGTRIELPQVFFMRVAMGLALREDKKNEMALEFYHLLSSFAFMSSTPTLFNSGTNHSQLSSCFLTTVPDDLKSIYKAISDNALLSKFAGGLGNDWTPVRALGAYIKGTNGKSQGVVPFLNVMNASAVAVNQGGKRKGAVVAYLETWHMDILEFLELRKNTGDDRRRTHDMHTANWIPDLFMERVMEDKDWTLFSPDDVGALHDLFGAAFKVEYERFEELAKQGEIRSFSIKAVTLWRKMLAMVFETGHPWFIFKDPCNIRSPQQHAGVVHSSNLCTEITLNTSREEVAVCNLGSINLPFHITDGALDITKLRKTVKTAIRMLDNVIDINYYSIDEARNSNMKHRPIGLGIMGFQDALFKMKMSYASEGAVSFADLSMEEVSYAAIEASMELARSRGKYKSFDGSLWSQGILPIDSVPMLGKTRGEYFKQDSSSTLDWQHLRKSVKKYGMRNSNVLAIAPTATISNICGVSQSIEPTYQNLFVKSNMSGEFTVVNEYLVRELKALGLWDEVMVNDLKYYDGSVQSIPRVPDELKERYFTAFEVPIKWLIQAASRRQKWIDQSQSLNLYMANPSGKRLDHLYRQAWLYGLKSTYYLRTLSATSVEKSTIKESALNSVIDTPTPKLCSIDDPDCEACQ